MKLVRADRGDFRFLLEAQDRFLFLAVLERYPLIPSAHQPVSRTSATGLFQSEQQLLDEALADQRKQNRQRLNTLLQDPKRFHETENGWQLILSPAEREWLLQILNDVRVGSWLKLGSPEEDFPELDTDSGLSPDALIMEMAGRFQMGLLESPT